jgi:hypothetical protein
LGVGQRGFDVEMKFFLNLTLNHKFNLN